MEKGNQMIGLSWEPKVPGLCSTQKINEHSNEPETALWMPNSKLVNGLFVSTNNPVGLNKLRKNKKENAGKNWFDLPATTLTPELKRDLQILKLRGAIDPKRHYKEGDLKQLPKYFQVGTVLEPATDFFTSRLTKKQRKESLAEELLADHALTNYRKRKIHEIDEKYQHADNKKWKGKLKSRKFR